MAKSSVQYLCSECGWNGPKWYGRCPECGQWGTIEEFHEARPAAASSRTAAPGRTARTTAGTVSARHGARPITQIDTDTVTRMPTGFGEFDRVLGGGIVPGSVVLIAGEPGIGKSTLLLETAGNIARAQAAAGGKVLYISGEESAAQVRLRATRINAVEGTCVTFTLDGHRSLPIEVQSLVTASVLPTPRRAVNGVDSNRIAMLTAVLYRHGKVNLLANDLYVSTIAGGLAKEPACDLAIVAALASAAKSKPIARTTCAVGEISLTGQVRPVPRLEYRLREAARLGFTTAVAPVSRKRIAITGLTIVEVGTLRDALSALKVV